MLQHQHVVKVPFGKEVEEACSQALLTCSMYNMHGHAAPWSTMLRFFWVQVVIMHRSVFESLMRTLKGHLLYQAEYLSRLLVKPPATRSEAEVLKMASYLTSLHRFQTVPQPQLVQLAKEVTYSELTPGALVCKQGTAASLSTAPRHACTWGSS